MIQLFKCPRRVSMLCILNFGDAASASLVGTLTILKDCELVLLHRASTDLLASEGFINLLEGWILEHILLELTKRLSLRIPASETRHREPTILAVSNNGNIISLRRVRRAIDALLNYKRLSRELNNVTGMERECCSIYTYRGKSLCGYGLHWATVELSWQDRHLCNIKHIDTI